MPRSGSRDIVLTGDQEFFRGRLTLLYERCDALGHGLKSGLGGLAESFVVAGLLVA